MKNMSNLATSMRTHTCNQLTKKEKDKKVKLCGWVHSFRDHGGLIFIDLRDKYGLTQICFDPKFEKKAYGSGASLRREDCIQVEGVVKERMKGMANPKLDTGDIEVFVSKLEIISKAEVPPIEVDDRIEANEEIRLKYRYLDLRRPIMQKRLQKRAETTKAFRDYLTLNGFLEVETPLLIKTTPEGARDYIVPSRVNPGEFYALPQSPQLYKQILMIAGCDRYFQVAKCLRDEDLRADRQPEHTQVDLEMSFVSEEDIRSFIEGMFKHIVKQVYSKDLKYNFPRISFKESMEKYGNDKPDLRFGLELKNVTALVKDSDFQVFKDVIKNGGIVKCINPEAEFSRNELDELISICVKNGAKGMAWMKFENGKLNSNIIKFFKDDLLKKLIKETGIKKGYLFFIADKEKTVNSVLSALRNELGKRLNLITDELKFCWIVDFPLFEFNDDENRWDFAHNPFVMPKKEHLQFIPKNPEKVEGYLYDLVLNGVELGSGAIRASKPEIQEKLFSVVGISEKEARDKFGFLLDAYKYGGPNHGGMGLGLDRFIALMHGTNDIREFIAFPKNKKAECPMDGSPSKPDDKQLKELHIKIIS